MKIIARHSNFVCGPRFDTLTKPRPMRLYFRPAGAIAALTAGRGTQQRNRRDRCDLQARTLALAFFVWQQINGINAG